MTSTTPAAPTTAEIREAISVIQIAVRDPYANPTLVASAHRLLVAARAVAGPPVKDWLDEYLRDETTADGATGFRRAVDDLARNFKLPTASTPPAPGEQGSLFADLPS